MPTATRIITNWFLKLEQISAIRGKEKAPKNSRKLVQFVAKKNKWQFVTFVAKKLLDWEPQVDFLTGLRQTIEYVKSSELMAAE